MAQNQERMQMIGSEILKQAQTNSDEITRKANEEYEQVIAAYKETTLNEMFEYTQSSVLKIRRDTSQQAAQYQVSLREKLLERRNQLTQTSWKNVFSRLKEFQKTPEYSKWFLSQLADLQTGYDHSLSTVSILKQDAALQDEITALLTNCTVEETSDIAIGGWRFYNSGAEIYIDNTLEEILSQQKRWYLAHCNLPITL